MPTIATTRKLTAKKNLITIPRREYEEFLMWQKKIKSAKTFKPTQSELRALALGRKDFKNGNYTSWEELKHELANRRSRPRKKTT